MKPLAFLLFSVALHFVLPAHMAHADVTHPAIESALGITPTVDVSIAPLAPPSDAHLWGTIAVAWDESIDPAHASGRLRVGEWDLHAARFLKVETLRSHEWLESPLVRLVRSGDALFVAVSGFVDASGNELLRLDLSLKETGHLELGEGWLPSLAIGDRFLAFGTYERGSYEECSPYHLRLVDLGSFRVVAARRFEQPLCPWPVPRFSTHALRFEGESLLIALAERQNPTVARLTIPALATRASIVVPLSLSQRWGLTSAAFLDARSPTLDVHNWGCARLSPSLRLATTPCPSAPRRSPTEPSIGEQIVARIHGHTVTVGVRQDPSEAEKDEDEKVNTRWVIRTLP